MADQSGSAAETARVVLEGVPRLSFEEHDGKVETCPFPSSLKASLEFMGEDIPYEYIMGTSGAAFRLLWNAGRWDGANVDVIVMASDPLEPYRRAFQAVGHAFEMFGNKQARHEASESVVFFDRQEDYGYFLSRIVESIRDKRRPVIGLGVVGPPEACVIAGYDERGEVLVGWSFFQDIPPFNAGVEFEPSGYFRQRDWFKDTRGLILIGEKREGPPPSEIHRGALEWALNIVRTSMVNERQSGPAAYAAWAEDLMHDEAFPADDIATLWERYMVHNDALTMVAEGRWYASLFLAQVARHEPFMAEELLLAAACYAAEHDIAWQIADHVGGFGFDEKMTRKLAEPDVRRRIAPLILQARGKDEEAAAHIERALARRSAGHRAERP
jgi:hypothetical protein